MKYLWVFLIAIATAAAFEDEVFDEFEEVDDPGMIRGFFGCIKQYYYCVRKGEGSCYGKFKDCLGGGSKTEPPTMPDTTPRPGHTKPTRSPLIQCYMKCMDFEGKERLPCFKKCNAQIKKEQ